MLGLKLSHFSNRDPWVVNIAEPVCDVYEITNRANPVNNHVSSSWLFRAIYGGIIDIANVCDKW